MHADNPGAQFKTRVRITRAMIPTYRRRAGRWERLAVDLLSRDGFKFTHQRQVGTYSLDLAFDRTKVAIEIQEKCHFRNDRKEREQRRDQYLLQEGWTVLKIRKPRRLSTVNFERRLREAAGVAAGRRPRFPEVRYVE